MVQEGVNKKNASKKCLELFPEDFFWSTFDENSPFGSDEGWQALTDYRKFRASTKNEDVSTFMNLLLRDISGQNLMTFGISDLDFETIDTKARSDNNTERYNDYKLDTSIIACGLGHLHDYGELERLALDIMDISINRQILYAKINENSTLLSNLYIIKERLLKL